MARLVLIRHGESTWNAQYRFTGWVDVPLSRHGRNATREAARRMGEHGIVVDVCFTSPLIRAIETAVICLTEADGICAGRSPVLRHKTRDPDWRGWDHYAGDAGIRFLFSCAARWVNAVTAARRDGTSSARRTVWATR
jgi:2,3-bisphosphoglycerate-dependent phosphoglycerate mutase